MNASKVQIKSAQDVQIMRAAGQRAAAVLEYIEPFVTIGITTNKLNQHAHQFIVDVLGDVPAPLHYRGFPKSICTSINHVVCHGIPEDRALRDGDIINIDVTVIHQGFHGDTSKMFLVGSPKILAKRLSDVAQQCLYRGIDLVKPGVHLGTIGAEISHLAHQHRFSVVEEYCGHGIGRVFHEPELQVLHYGTARTGIILQPGMTFTIEPMINVGKRHTKLLQDKWTVVTRDKSLSAQWEHTLAVTDDGVEVLTIREEEREIAASHGWKIPPKYIANAD